MTLGKRAGKTKHLLLFHSLHLDFYVKTTGNKKKKCFSACLMRVKYNNAYIFNLQDYYILTKTSF